MGFGTARGILALIPFAEGNLIPVLDVPHIIYHAPDARRGVWREEGRLYVSGKAEHLPRRVRDWFKDESLRIISPLAHKLAQRIDSNISHISIRDPRSRWGSCSQDGRLSFSWRLLMAPDHVVQYIVAHEVAHLRELNHSEQFWQTVEILTEHRDKATLWIKQFGLDLHRYGLDY